MLGHCILCHGEIDPILDWFYTEDNDTQVHVACYDSLHESRDPSIYGG